MPTTARPGPQQIWRVYDEAADRGDHDAAGAYLAPDYARTFVGALEDGDRAVVEWRMHGTPAPDVDLLPLDVPGCPVVRCADGRIVEARLHHPTGALDRIADRALGRG